ncbi:Short C-terminal domain-containing protein [Ruminococcaceae bacterium FB2012]|nr:Short C-terminal domain-containing protein [Ruminococcaceae bacterium FB2012]
MEAVWIIMALLWGIVWGACTRQNVIDKGYDSVGAYFLLGFFLGFIGFIIAYAKPDIKKEEQERMMREIYYNSRYQSQPQQPQYQAPTNDWRCTCGAMNKDYETSCHRCGKEISEVTWSCSCGMRNQKNAAFCEKCGKPNTTPETQPAKATLNADNVQDELKKYKEMLDDGLITEEEFAAKKKQLLGI